MGGGEKGHAGLRREWVRVRSECRPVVLSREWVRVRSGCRPVVLHRVWAGVRAGDWTKLVNEVRRRPTTGSMPSALRGA